MGRFSKAETPAASMASRAARTCVRPKEKPQEAQVVAVGTGKVADDGTVTPLDVKVGDRILLGKYSGTEVTLDGEEHLIIREDDVLGILE